MDAAIDTEKWLAENTGYCERLLARVTKEQCRKNKGKAKMGFEPIYIPCLKCKGITPGQTMKTKKKAKNKKKGSNMTQIYCQICNREAVNIGKGLCGACYRRIPKKERDKYKLEDAVRVGEESKATSEPITPEQGEIVAEPVTQELQEEDPLAGAELIQKKYNNYSDAATAHISRNGKILYFNSPAVRNFGLQDCEYVCFYEKNGQALLKLDKESSADAFKLTKKYKNRQRMNITLSIKSMLKKFGWEPEQTLEIIPTSRPDVIKLEPRNED